MIIYKDQDPLFVINEENKFKVVFNFKLSEPNLNLTKIIKRHYNDPEPCIFKVTSITNDSFVIEWETFEYTLFLSEYKQAVDGILRTVLLVMDHFKGEF